MFGLREKEKKVDKRYRAAIAYSSPATERSCPKWFLGQKLEREYKKNLTKRKAEPWIEGN